MKKIDLRPRPNTSKERAHRKPTKAIVKRRVARDRMLEAEKRLAKRGEIGLACACGFLAGRDEEMLVRLHEDGSWDGPIADTLAEIDDEVIAAEATAREAADRELAKNETPGQTITRLMSDRKIDYTTACARSIELREEHSAETIALTDATTTEGSEEWGAIVTRLMREGIGYARACAVATDRIRSRASQLEDRADLAEGVMQIAQRLMRHRTLSLPDALDNAKPEAIDNLVRAGVARDEAERRVQFDIDKFTSGPGLLPRGAELA